MNPQARINRLSCNLNILGANHSASDEYYTDAYGILLLRTCMVTCSDSTRKRLLERRSTDNNASLVLAKSCEDRIPADEQHLYDLVDVCPLDGRLLALYRKRNGRRVILVSARHIRLVQHLCGSVDLCQGKCRTDPCTLWRDGQLVGLVMPLRHPDPIGLVEQIRKEEADNHIM